MSGKRGESRRDMFSCVDYKETNQKGNWVD